MDDRWNRIPDGIDPIVGYRAWYYTIGQRGARLHPLVRRGSGSPTGIGDWDGASWSWVTATCSHVAASWHVAPEEDCTCGFYAMSTLPPVVSGCGFRTVEIGSGSTSGVVLGRVELAGKIIEHEWGYRAERARIAELIPFRGTEQSVMILAARLGLSIAEPVDVPSVQDEFAGLARHPRAGPPRFRDYVEEHRWMAATILVGLVVVAMQPTTITTVVLFALLYARKFDHSVAPRQAPTPFPNRARPTLPPPSLPNGSPPAA
jgi:hypothetical protein